MLKRKSIRVFIVKVMLLLVVTSNVVAQNNSTWNSTKPWERTVSMVNNLLGEDVGSTFSQEAHKVKSVFSTYDPDFNDKQNYIEIIGTQEASMTCNGFNYSNQFEGQLRDMKRRIKAVASEADSMLIYWLAITTPVIKNTIDWLNSDLFAGLEASFLSCSSLKQLADGKSLADTTQSTAVEKCITQEGFNDPNCHDGNTSKPYMAEAVADYKDKMSKKVTSAIGAFNDTMASNPARSVTDFAISINGKKLTNAVTKPNNSNSPSGLTNSTVSPALASLPVCEITIDEKLLQSGAPNMGLLMLMQGGVTCHDYNQMKDMLPIPILSEETGNYLIQPRRLTARTVFNEKVLDFVAMYNGMINTSADTYVTTSHYIEYQNRTKQVLSIDKYKALKGLAVQSPHKAYGKIRQLAMLDALTEMKYMASKLRSGVENGMYAGESQENFTPQLEKVYKSSVDSIDEEIRSIEERILIDQKKNDIIYST
ncbi:MAG: hypothetical protein V3T17_09815 [Pseudomonadales bacterium]